MNTTRCLLRLGMASLLLLQAACIGSTSPARFYLLEPLAEVETQQTDSSRPRMILSLAPVRLPAYLDRSQIVSASDKNTYRLDEYHRWAENLGDNMTRVMVQDLSVLLPADVVINSTLRAKQAQLRLTVGILAFHVNPQGLAELSAQWQVSRDNEVVLSQHSSLRAAVNGDDMSLKVRALNQCLNQLSRDIAAAVKLLKVD